MAFSVTKCDVGGSTANGYHYEFLCESADDIADLPTGASSTEISRPAPGSLAYIESDSSARYILKNSREWGEYPMAGGGGGSTGGGVLVVTKEEYTLNKTWQEIADADAVVIKDLSVASYVVPAAWEFVTGAESSDGYVVRTLLGDTNGGATQHYYIADSADGYPVLD